MADKANAYQISNSVGDNGKNLEGDVRTIQELLNSINARDGGPSPPLKVDGKCGPKTKGAIQKFQLEHFGWKLADARVDPGGPTHNRMRLCAARNQWKGAIFQVRRKENDSETAPQGSQILFDVSDDINPRWCLYAFSESTVNAAALSPVPLLFEGSPFTLRFAYRRPITDLSGGCAIHNISLKPQQEAPWPGLYTPKSESSLTVFVAGTTDDPPETAYATARFNVAAGARYGKFQFIVEKPWKYGPWNP